MEAAKRSSLRMLHLLLHLLLAVLLALSCHSSSHNRRLRALLPSLLWSPRQLQPSATRTYLAPSYPSRPLPIKAPFDTLKIRRKRSLFETSRRPHSDSGLSFFLRGSLFERRHFRLLAVGDSRLRLCVLRRVYFQTPLPDVRDALCGFLLSFPQSRV